MVHTQSFARSRAGVDRLEEIQAEEYRGQPPGPRDEQQDRRILREIAQRQLMAERLADMSAAADYRDALVELVGEPGYEAAVEMRTRELEAYYLGADGDIWSQYERPDHRRRLSELVPVVEGAAMQTGYDIPDGP